MGGRGAQADNCLDRDDFALPSIPGPRKCGQQHRSGDHSRFGQSDRPEQSSPKANRSEEHTSELQSLMRISYAVFCLKKKKHNINNTYPLIVAYNQTYKLPQHSQSIKHNNLIRTATKLAKKAQNSNK